jgi:hypothetical protein
LNRNTLPSRYPKRQALFSSSAALRNGVPVRAAS